MRVFEKSPRTPSPTHNRQQNHPNHPHPTPAPNPPCSTTNAHPTPNHTPQHANAHANANPHAPAEYGHGVAAPLHPPHASRAKNPPAPITLTTVPDVHTTDLPPTKSPPITHPDHNAPPTPSTRHGVAVPLHPNTPSPTAFPQPTPDPLLVNQHHQLSMRTLPTHLCPPQILREKCP
jgi:hypothetical protein